MFKKITKQYNYKFNVTKDRLYSIAIEANCKSGKILGLFGGEDLRVEIDDIKFREIPAKKRAQYFNIPPAWNGTKLKRLPKTIIFILKLKKGEHILKFIPKKGAIIEKEPQINLIKNNKLTLNNQAKDENRRPWVTLALIDLELRTLDISIKCEQRPKDSDDVKLIIDNEIQQNKQSNWWGKNWYWQGKQSQGKTEETRFYPRLPKGIHYIELWSDRMPTLNWISMDLGIKPVKTIKEDKKTIQKYTYKGPYGTYDYNCYDTEIENIVNEWNKEFLNDKYPPKNSLDPSLVKAIIYQESKVGYYPGGEIDIMQVGDDKNPALKTLQGIEKEYWLKNGKQIDLEYKEAQVKNPFDSIYWGVRWLYHKAQGITKSNKRYWVSWEQATIDYNGSLRKIEYQAEVWRMYKEGIDPKGNILWQKNQSGCSLLKILISIFLILAIFFIGYFLSNESSYQALANTQEGDNQEQADYSGLTSIKVQNAFLVDLENFKTKKAKNGYGDYFADTSELCQKLTCGEIFLFYENHQKLIDNMEDNKHFLLAIDSLEIASFIKPRNVFHTQDIDNDGENEIIFSLYYPMYTDHVSLAIIDKINGQYEIVKEKIDSGQISYIEFMDINNDLKPEILFYVIFSRGYDLIIYEYQDDKQLKEIFNSYGNDIYNSEYIFSDLDKDKNIEIKIDGEIRYTPDHGKKIQEIYEYNPDKDSFILL